MNPTGPFRKILVAIDSSENSERALHLAKALAGDGPATVSLVHVVQPTFSAVGTYPYAFVDTAPLQKLREEEGHKLLEASTGQFRGSKVEVDSHLISGRSGEEICKLAKEGGYDLIVMGRRGVGRLEEAILGSVSGYVVRHSDLPVLIVQ